MTVVAVIILSWLTQDMNYPHRYVKAKTQKWLQFQKQLKSLIFVCEELGEGCHPLAQWTILLYSNWTLGMLF